MGTTLRQVKFSLAPALIEFLNHYKQYGYKDKSSMVQAALVELQEDINLQQLKESAELYAEIYEQDTELQELTHAAIDGWPE